MRGRLIVFPVLVAAAACSSSMKTTTSSTPRRTEAPTTSATPTTDAPTTTRAPKTTLAPKSGRPDGVGITTWDDWCQNDGKAFEAALRGYVNKTDTADETVSKLKAAQTAIQKDADNTENATWNARFQAVADAVGHMKVAVAEGNDPNFNEVSAVVNAFPSC